MQKAYRSAFLPVIGSQPPAFWDNKVGGFQKVIFLTNYQQILNRLLCNFIIKYEKNKRCYIGFYKRQRRLIPELKRFALFIFIRRKTK